MAEGTHNHDGAAETHTGHPTPMTHSHDGGGEVHTGHPTPMTYFKVAMILSVITAIEVAIFYVEDLGHGIIPILVVLSAAKFALVAMFYMHLRYDAKLFTSFFVGGLILAFTIGIALLALFKFFV